MDIDPRPFGRRHSDRRKFIRTSAGLLGLALAPGVFRINLQPHTPYAYPFRPYRPGKTLAPVLCITPDDGFYLHTFYNKCPWSPGKRFFAVTRLPYQQRKPRWGDTADVCIIDLEERTIRRVYQTRAWGFQLGANLQWGHGSDRYLFTNDVIDGQVHCVRLDLEQGTARVYAGAKYDLSPDDRTVISPQLLNMNKTQYGYAVPDPPTGEPRAFTREDLDNEGLWQTDLVKNQRRLLVPFRAFVEAAGPDRAFYARAVPYLFHCQYNAQNSRILQVLRAQVDGMGRNASLFSMQADGSGLQQCLSKERWNQKALLGGSGNHPNWHPDGEHIIMNCIPTWLGDQHMRFCKFRYDGSGFTILSEKHPGSGHPSVDPSGRYLLADAYPKQTYVSGPDGEIPIRLLDLQHDEERILCTIANDVGGGGKQYTDQTRREGGSQYKLDPHPVWRQDGRAVALNGAPEGRRQVFVADVSAWVK